MLFHKAYGLRAVEPDRVPMTEDTVFDLASLTKPIATATALMILVDRDKLELDDPIARYVPGVRPTRPKRAITLRHLLTHVSGLPAETPLDDYRTGAPKPFAGFAAIEPRSRPVRSSSIRTSASSCSRRSCAASPARTSQFTRETIFGRSA